MRAARGAPAGSTRGSAATLERLVRRGFPGLGVATGLAVIGVNASAMISGLPAAPLVLVAGVTLAAPSRMEFLVPGGRWAGQWLLRLGVMLLGAQLSISAIVDQGLASIGWIVCAISGVIGLAYWIGGRLGVPPSLRVLLGVGIGVCGNSAIAAVAPLVHAPRAHIAIAIGMVMISGTASVLLYPVFGALMGLDQSDFGRWSGIAIADTGQVLAASLGYGDEAVETATVTKLLRNAFIGPVAIAVAVLWMRRESPSDEDTDRPDLSTVMPPFVVGFVALAALRSSGVIDTTLADGMSRVGSFSILVGLGGIGMSTRLGALRSAGIRTVWLGVIIVVGLSVITLVLIRLGIA